MRNRRLRSVWVGKLSQKLEEFKYLGCMVQSNSDINEDITHEIRAGWAKRRQVIGFLCDKRLVIKLKGKYDRTLARPVLVYGPQWWTVKKGQEQRTQVAEMAWNRIRNEYIRGNIGMVDIKGKMSQHRLWSFGHVMRRGEKVPVKTILGLRVTGRRGRDRPKLISEGFEGCNSSTQPFPNWRDKGWSAFYNWYAIIRRAEVNLTIMENNTCYSRMTKNRMWGMRFAPRNITNGTTKILNMKKKSLSYSYNLKGNEVWTKPH